MSKQITLDVQNNTKKENKKHEHEKSHILQVYKTYDYDKFNLLDYNRDIKETHVRKIVESMQKKLLENYQHVTKDMEVIDGQHSLYAKKRLGLPIYYIIHEDYEPQDIIKINTQSNWRDIDFIECYSKLGNEYSESYRKILKLREEFPQLGTLRIYIQIATTQKKALTSLRDGTYLADNYKNARKECIKLMDYDFLNGINYAWGHGVFFQAMFAIMKHKEYKHDRFLKALTIYHSRLSRLVSKQEYLNKLTDIYNHMYSKKKIKFNIEV